MSISAYIDKVKTSPGDLEFNELMELVDTNYTFTATEFSNGDLLNFADQNQGSCKLFSFARLHGLTQDETLACFGEFYRQDVLTDPAGNNHQNIRNFMKYGWEGVRFSGDALSHNS
jgi:hypothetical protein